MGTDDAKPPGGAVLCDRSDYLSQMRCPGSRSRLHFGLPEESLQTLIKELAVQAQSTQAEIEFEDAVREIEMLLLSLVMLLFVLLLLLLLLF